MLDLFSGAGGAAMGYRRAGFEVVGVDIAPQPSYPFAFVQADALEWLEEWVLSGHERFDAVHASPPCQAHVKGLAAMNRSVGRSYGHLDWIPATRALLRECGLPYVIENVVGAELEDPVRLCGSSFGLDVRRHRLFECSFPLLVPPCNHSAQREPRFWNGDRSTRNPDGTRSYTGHERLSGVVQVYGDSGDRKTWGPAMGIDWMHPEELREAIPPAYTELIGAQLMASLGS